MACFMKTACVFFTMIFLMSCSSAVTPTIEDSVPTEISTPIPVKTASQTRTQYHPTSTQNSYLLTLSPGQYILYQIDIGNKVNLSALSLSTGESYTLYDSSYPSLFELSPRFNRLAILKGKQVELTDFVTGATKTVNFENVCSSAAWSPDESNLVLACGDIFIVSLSDLNIIQLTDLFTLYSSYFGEVSWSPDGKWLAYNNVADPYGDDPYDGIYITDITCLSAIANCKNQTKFFHGLFYQFVALTWSLDSSQVTFLALGNIYKLDTVSMQIILGVELSHENFYDITGFACSPDNSRFALSNELEKKIILISSETGEEVVSFPVAGTVFSWIEIP